MNGLLTGLQLLRLTACIMCNISATLFEYRFAVAASTRPHQQSSPGRHDYNRQGKHPKGSIPSTGQEKGQPQPFFSQFMTCIYLFPCLNINKLDL